MKKLFILSLTLISMPTWANYNLALNGKEVNCYGADNQSFRLNQNRTTIKYVVEGETKGPEKITSVKTNQTTYISYHTSEGTLTFSTKGDFYKFKDDQAGFQVDCQ